MASARKTIDWDHGRPELHNGDRMMRSEFHVAYSQMPQGYRAELIGGIVFEPSPVSYSHGKSHLELGCLLKTYARLTPNTEVAADATLILGADDEVQPDLVLRIARGGRSHLTENDYILGAPELVAEIAYSSRAIDLHLKKERYKLAGVAEYIVVSVKPKRLWWFDLPNSRELEHDDSGIFRSAVFPGLWIHGEGLLDLNEDLTLAAINDGLNSPEHKMYVNCDH